MTQVGGCVRRSNPGDLHHLVALWIEITRNHASVDPLFTLRSGVEPEVRRLLAAQLAHADGAVFVWEDADLLLGFCSVRVDRAPPILVETVRAEITDLGVREAARRRGIGTALADAALAWVRGRGIVRVEVRVAAGNPAAQGFWRALGFGDLMDVLQRRL
ncbi:MAG: GNAT family N-acetyltransferase [Myxococcota bacterium]